MAVQSSTLKQLSEKRGAGHQRQLDHFQEELFATESDARHTLEKAKTIVRILFPVYVLLRDVDSGRPMMPVFYNRMCDVIAQIKNETSVGFEEFNDEHGSFQDKVAGLFEQRWDGDGNRAALFSDIHQV